MAVWHPPEAYPPCIKRHGGGWLGRRRTRGSSNCAIKYGGDQKKAIMPSVPAVVSRVRHDMGNGYVLAKGISKRAGGGGNSDTNIVTGYYIQHDPAHPSERVVLWLYGGAYLAGDSEGNLSLAEKVGQRCCGADVFLPDYRLLPEWEFYDALHDVVLAYEYLISVRGKQPENVVLLGISSGGGLATRLMQTIAELRADVASKRNNPADQVEDILRNPAGGVLMCPFVDYTEPKGSFKDYVKHDLIVNQSVFEEGIPHLASLGTMENRQIQSPAHRSFVGLPPLCVVVSEHECCYDQTVLLVNRARADGVETKLGVWRYMCHVFPVLSMFLPEGKQAMDFMVDWMWDRLTSSPLFA
eukprot:CAMPEP_0183313458 /NCGR_PEP_ID=MMETSP0160_2-20130417/45377_1 /TAXON_ID=2839 ORGANISM="Odontella Sinensis, Strain Grunow 1884" /NCGR_SAMPLE_ID=MMETSP0160_2 /ASSEMBLY_ACC=CAM_ASM_000250 /LENGTH=354 /DNA_ID=CAMNT_0025478549 /DNA_START=286 /DNA_END=1350 /DNA_ORIENTATION=+